MEYLKIFIVPGLIIIGSIIHIEVTLAILKNDIKWIKKDLNSKKE